MPLPKIFISSSSKQLATARVLGSLLEQCAEAIVWDQYFEMNHSFFASLLKAADQFDFAVMILGADDVASIGGVDVAITRDNVVFELGLFIGGMGKERVWWLTPDGSGAPRTLSDLEGIKHLTFPPPESSGAASLSDALALAAQRICRTIRESGPRFETLNRVKILCVSSVDYPVNEFAEDLAEIHRNFPTCSVVSLHGAKADELRNAIRAHDGKWDLIHLAVNVDARTGDLMLPDPEAAGNDGGGRIAEELFQSWVEHSQARLVVAMMCDSAQLAVRLARVTNVIGALRLVELSTAIKWSKEFYESMARGRPLNESFNLAQLANRCLFLVGKKDFRLDLATLEGESCAAVAAIRGR